MGAGAVDYSFDCFGDPFSPTGLPHPDLIRGVVLSLIAIYYAMSH